MERKFDLNRLRSLFGFGRNDDQNEAEAGLSLAEATLEQEYVIEAVDAFDESIRSFLFTLGCYPGERITVVNRLADQFVIVIKDARYSINKELARTVKLT